MFTSKALLYYMLGTICACT